MSHDPDRIDDKLEQHHRQQLSALVDGELAPDEARFLLRRLEHDADLGGRFERWQLCGDVLRGQVRRAAAPDLGARIAAALAAAPAASEAAVPPQAAVRRRQAWTRWGGGAALAASVAAVAMFVGRPLATDPSHVPAPVAAMQALPSTEAILADAAPAVVEAPVATQSQRRPAPVRAQREPARMVAVRVPAASAAPSLLADAVADAGPQALAAVPAPDDPFASPAPLQARPWPRAALAQPAGSAYTAGFGEPAASASFYPFEPRLPPPAAAEGAGRPAPVDHER
ncbi:MAG: hypothetical protein IAF01_11730 [Xanthomonadaceae bacterium]|nr:hypothetical protein [Xanthomonadaceae bacterium]MCA0198003.1 hypothetical protein [Pseudomonadota bacterium]